MSKQTIVVIIAALLLFGGVLGASLAFIGDSSDQPVHTMPDGTTMPGMDHDG